VRLTFPILKPISFIKEAIEQLDTSLSNPQKTNLILILSAIIISQSLSLSTLSLTLLGKRSVNALSHFFSYAGLNAYKLMGITVHWMIHKVNLKKMPIRLAIDDTMKHHSKGAKKIASVYWLFDHVLQSYCNASCIVFVYLIVNERIRFPIGWRVYKKGGRSKWRLALEIIDEVLERDLKITAILFDSWFCVRGFIKQLERRKLTFIADMKSSNTLEYQLPQGGKPVRVQVGKLINYRKYLFKEVLLGLKSSEKSPDKVLYKTYSGAAYVTAFKKKYQLVYSIDQRTGASKTFICNDLSWEAGKILEEYSYRWMIEEFFGNAKGLCGLEKACIRSEQGGALALFLVSYVDLLFSLELWKGIHDYSQGKLPTVSAISAAAAEENLRIFLSCDQHKDKLEEIAQFWLKCLRKRQKKSRRSRKELVVMRTIDAKKPLLPKVSGKSPDHSLLNTHSSNHAA